MTYTSAELPLGEFTVRVSSFRTASTMWTSTAAEESWRLTLQHSPIGMALVGLDGQILVVNPALCDMLGYEPEQLRSKRFQDITHADDLQEKPHPAEAGARPAWVVSGLSAEVQGQFGRMHVRRPWTLTSATTHSPRS